MNKMMAIALQYAEFGWPVFPIHTPTGDNAKPCSCRRITCPQLGKHPCHKNSCKDRGKHPCHQIVCDSAGKHPRTKNGVRDASTDEARIRRWWETWEDANIGVATGKEAGFFALDVDPRKGGAEALASLVAKHGKLPETRTADTGGGGVHHLFKYPDFPVKNTTGKLGPGLDIKGEGGSIGVAIPEGQRNDTLTSLAGTMRRRGMGFDEIEAALLVTNNKRCDPPLAEDEVRKIASNVCRYKPAGETAFR